MASNNEYKRYFIILQEDDKGYEMSPGKIPTGYVKIEVKNNKVRLNTFIQNIKLEERIEYRLILVSSVRKLAVDIGKIIIDGSGRGELSCELESDNVLKSGLGIGNFNIAAVVSGVSVPLSGYIGRDKLEWKGKYDLVNVQKAQDAPRIDKKIKIEEIVPERLGTPIPVPPIEKPAPPPEVLKEITEEITGKAPEKVPEEFPKEALKEVPEEVSGKVTEKVQIEIKAELSEEVPPVIEIIPGPEPEIILQQQVIESKMPECPPIVPMEEPFEIEKEKVKKVEKKECEDIYQYYCDDDSEEEEYEEHRERITPSYYGGSMYIRMKKVFGRLKKSEPFERERGYEWFRVGEDIFEINSVAVPYMGYMMPMGYPFMSEGCSMMIDRKDYILGIRYDDTEVDDDERRRIRCLLFGVPAIYSRKNEQYYKSRGFMEFKPHRFKGYGYFIMCLDLRNGMLCHMNQ